MHAVQLARARGPGGRRHRDPDLGVVLADVGGDRALADRGRPGEDGQTAGDGRQSPGANSRSSAATCLVPEPADPAALGDAEPLHDLPGAHLAEAGHRLQQVDRPASCRSPRCCWPSSSTSLIEAPECFEPVLDLGPLPTGGGGLLEGRLALFGGERGQSHGPGPSSCSQSERSVGQSSQYPRARQSTGHRAAQHSTVRRRSGRLADVRACCSTPASAATVVVRCRARSAAASIRPAPPWLRPSGGSSRSYVAGSTPGVVERLLQRRRARSTTLLPLVADVVRRLVLRGRGRSGAPGAARPAPPPPSDLAELVLVLLDRVAVVLVRVAAHPDEAARPSGATAAGASRPHGGARR